MKKKNKNWKNDSNINKKMENLKKKKNVIE